MNLIEKYPLLKELVKNIKNIPRIHEWTLRRPQSSVQKEEEEYDSIYNNF